MFDCDIVYRTHSGRQFDVGVLRNRGNNLEKMSSELMNTGKVREGKTKSKGLNLKLH